MIGTYDNAARDGAIARTPLGRIALPEESDVARFLIEDGPALYRGRSSP